MAYKIATEGEAAAIGGGSTLSSSRGCTKSRALALGCSLRSPSSGYENNRLIRLDDLYKQGPTIQYYNTPQIILQMQSSVKTAAINYGYEEYQLSNGAEYDAQSGSSSVSGIVTAQAQSNGQIYITYNQFSLIANQTYRIYFWFYTEKRLQLNKLYGTNNCSCNNVSSLSNSHIDATLGPNSPSITGGNTFYIDIKLKDNNFGSSTLTITVIGMEDVY